jgi:hypothetical protein
MQLNALITAVEDGRLSLRIEELPDLVVDAKRYEEIPDTVSEAAAQLLGRQPEDFTVEILY